MDLRKPMRGAAIAASAPAVKTWVKKDAKESGYECTHPGETKLA